MANEKRLASSVISGVLVTVIKVSLGIITLPFLLQHLDKETFGLYVFTIGIIDLLLLLDIMSGGIMRLIIEFRAKQKDTEAQELLSSGNVLFLSLSSLVFAIGWFCIPFLISLIHIPASLKTIATYAFALILIEGVMILYSTFHRAILRMHHRNYWTNFGDFIFNIGSCLSIFVLIGLGYSIVTVFIARIICNLVRFCIILAHSYQVEPNSFKVSFSASKESFKRLSEYTFFALLNNGSSFLSFRIDNLVIATLLKINLVGLYGVINQLLSPVNMITWKIMENFYPLMLRLNAEEKVEQSKALFLRISSLLNILLCWMFISFAVFASYILHYFSSGKYEMSPLLWALLIIKMLCLWSGTMLLPANQYLYAVNAHRYCVSVNSITAVANLCFSLVLTPIFSIVGVALGTLIPQFFQVHFFLIRRARKGLNVSFKEYLSQVILQGMPAAILICLLLLLLKPVCLMLPIPLVGIIIASLFVMVSGIGLWFIQSSTEYERQLVAKSFASTVSKLKINIKKASVEV